MSKRRELDATYVPQLIERTAYKQWESKGFFKPKGDGLPYSIVIPPPNVTGRLHLGHAFQQTIMDFLIRFQRMSRSLTLWQTGTDHAGIATQMVVTERLRSEGISPADLGREEFTQRVWDWRNEATGAISDQIRRIGSSVDWSRERFTMDEGFSHAVFEVFVRLYDEGLIYRGKRLVNWDPTMETALSDLEVINEEENGRLWHIRYPLADGTKTRDNLDYVVVATTRPETMFGDTAVAVNPDDERFNDLIGKSVVLPLVGRRLSILGDRYVDPEFGTGCLKITPAHDFNDNEIGARHDLDEINIFSSSACLNENVPEPYQGLDRFVARDKVIEDLDQLGLIHLIEDYKVQIPRGERTNAILEPWLTDQWFVSIQALADPAIKAVEDGRVKFVPQRWENVYFSWMRDIKDWCISRQLWWGHQIPAWYDEANNIYVGRNLTEVREKYDLAPEVKLTQDPDVLETWFSSALWTFATMGWPDTTEDLEKFHPTNVLVTGHDIIFFWVARMIMMALHFTGEVPFHEVYVTGLVRDKEGQKMTKTKGNGLDPLDVIDGIECADLIEKRTANLTQNRLKTSIEKATRKEFPNGIPAYGTDALRFTFAAIASPGSSYNFDLQQVEGYHFFCNKLWNAAKFVLANVDDDFIVDPDFVISENAIEARWIVSSFRTVIVSCRNATSDYRFDRFAQATYQFVWHEFCDWYLEIAKLILQRTDAEPSDLETTRTTLLVVFEATLRLLHPLMPFITEEIWQKFKPHFNNQDESIMLMPYPSENNFLEDKNAEKTVEWLKDVVTAIRQLRSTRQISPALKVPIDLYDTHPFDDECLRTVGPILCELARGRLAEQR